MNRVIVVGSPRVDGRSAHLADQLLYACIEECPEDVVSIVSVASTDVRPCCGCDACARASEPADEEPMEEGDPLTPHPLIAESNASQYRCVIDDDMAEVRKHLDAADELIVVSPVYFAGPPAQFKALLDRLQPYWRSDVRMRGKRPMILHVVGEGGDPHGYDPLVGSVRSALSVAGFELVSIFDWVGKISEEGDFLGEPQEYALMDESYATEAETAEPTAETNVMEFPGKNRAASASASNGEAKPKPMLSLSQHERKGGSWSSQEGRAPEKGTGKRRGAKHSGKGAGKSGKPGKGGGRRG